MFRRDEACRGDRGEHLVPNQDKRVVAQVFQQVMDQNAQFAKQCHEFLGKVQSQEDTGRS
jgi:hypothetical protein